MPFPPRWRHPSSIPARAPASAGCLTALSPRPGHLGSMPGLCISKAFAPSPVPLGAQRAKFPRLGDSHFPFAAASGAPWAWCPTHWFSMVPRRPLQEPLPSCDPLRREKQEVAGSSRLSSLFPIEHRFISPAQDRICMKTTDWLSFEWQR